MPHSRTGSAVHGSRADLDVFEFGADRIPVLHQGDDHLMPLKAMADALGLDARAQQRLVERAPWSEGCTAITAAQLPGDGQTRQHFMISHRIVPMWIANITASRIKDDETRSKVVQWQREFATALYQYVFEGGAINPRATEDQLASIIGRAEGQARVLQALAGIVDKHWLEAKGRHVAARALGEEPEVDPTTRPLTTGEYLAECGVAGVLLRSVSSRFGKTLAGIYRERYNANPPKVERFVDGALREVNGYTERDRPLFDQAWAQILGTDTGGTR